MTCLFLVHFDLCSEFNVSIHVVSHLIMSVEIEMKMRLYPYWDDCQHDGKTCI
uniref:Uncharacterized protein n=1 Tax=Triticum urartu TaxID=4572 RepID=A0A8R7QBG1_TRIUA